MDFSSNKDDTAAKKPQQPTIVTRKRRSAWSTVAFFFLVVLLVAVAAGAWMWYAWQDDKQQLTSVKSELVAAQTTIGNLREQIGEANGQAAAEAQAPINDEKVITTTVESYNAVLATPLKDVKISLTKKDGTQAVAAATDGTAGYNIYLKKSDNTWIVVWAGQGTPPADIAKQYALTI